MVVLYNPSTFNRKLVNVYIVLNVLFQSVQGIIVSVLYCFTNNEVRNVLNAAWSRRRMSHSFHGQAVGGNNSLLTKRRRQSLNSNSFNSLITQNQVTNNQNNNNNNNNNENNNGHSCDNNNTVNNSGSGLVKLNNNHLAASEANESSNTRKKQQKPPLSPDAKTFKAKKAEKIKKSSTLTVPTGKPKKDNSFPSGPVPQASITDL